jgi:hypothetical protein
LGQEETETQFHGKQLPALDFINRASLNEKDPFSLTDIMRFEKTSGKFIKKSTVLNIGEEDLNEIKNGNFVYTPYYTMGRNPNFETSEPRGAFVIGTTDQGLIKALHRSVVKDALKTNKINQKK